MIKIFLKAKHWQLFVLIFVLPIILQFIVMGFLMSSFMREAEPDFSVMFHYMKYFSVIMIFLMTVFWGWLGSIGIGLQNKIPENIKMKVKNFKALFFIAFVYYLSFMVFINILLTNGFLFSVTDYGFPVMGIIVLLIFPLHLFSMFCMLYSVYFVAKTIKTVELQKEVGFKDFVEEFILILFYPIGLWVIQPKINKIFRDSL